MSILNRHISSVSVPKKSWNLSIYVKEFGPGINIDKFAYIDTISNLNEIYDLFSINIICATKTISNLFSDISNLFPDIISAKNNISLQIDSEFSPLCHIKKFIYQQKNIIYLTDRSACLKPQLETDFIYGYIDDTYDELYEIILKKFGLKHLINSNILIVPYNPQTQNQLTDTVNFYNKLTGLDTTLKTNISLSVVNYQYGSTIRDLTIEKQFIRNIDELIYNKNIREKYFPQNQIDLSEFNYHNYSNYLFYPMMDLDYNYVPEKPKKTENPTNLATINTNRFTSPTVSFSKLFHRYDDPTQGIYIRKPDKKYSIPKIVHHIWADTESSINYINLWKKQIKDPWIYMVWDSDKIESFMNKSNWKIIYDHVDSPTKKLVVSLAIMETHGGIIIDTYCIPVKNLDDLLCGNKFFISFKDPTNLQLSYRFMGSLPSVISTNDKNRIDPNIGKKPTEGINNFFRQVNYGSQYLSTIPELFDKLRSLLYVSNEQFEIKNLDTYLLNNSDVFVYPSYLFHPNRTNLPKQLTTHTVAILLYKPIVNQIKTKTKVTRNYIATKEAIIDRLSENPRDRLRNIKPSLTVPS